MKGLNTYITEKLHIKKGMKTGVFNLNDEQTDVFEKICHCCSYDINNLDYTNPIIIEISKWIKKNDVRNINAYTDINALSLIEKDKDILRSFINDGKTTFNIVSDLLIRNKNACVLVDKRKANTNASLYGDDKYLLYHQYILDAAGQDQNRNINRAFKIVK